MTRQASEILIEAENTILATAINKPEFLHDLEIEPDDFHTELGASVYAAIKRLIDSKKSISLVSVASDMQKAGDLARIGGLEELKRVASGVPTRVVRQYVSILRDHAQEIRIARAAADLAEIARASDAPIADRFKGAESVLADLMKGSSGGRDPIHISEGVRAALKESLEREGMPEGWIPGLKTGLPQLDAVTGGFRGGNLIVVGGRSSMGKSALSMRFAEAAARQKSPVYLVSMEMTTGEITQRLAASMGKVNLSAIMAGRMDGEEMCRYGQAIARANDLPIWIDDAGGLTADKICQMARRQHHKKGLGLLVIDQLSLIDYSRYDSLTRGMGEATGKFKALAKELNIPVMVLAQINREAAKGAVRRPAMTDIQDCGKVEQDADVIILVHRPSYYEPEKHNPTLAELIVAKNRNGRRGDILECGYIGEYTRFQSMPDMSAQPIQPVQQATARFEDYDLD